MVLIVRFEKKKKRGLRSFIADLMERRKEREEREEERAKEEQQLLIKITTNLVRKGVSVQEARRLAPLVARGELSVKDAKELAKRLRRRRLKKLEKRLTAKPSRGRPGGFASRLSEAIEKDIIAGFQAWGTPSSTRRRKRKHKGRVIDLGHFGPV